MESTARILLIIGVASIVISLLLSLGVRLNLGRLPGDIMIKRDHFTFYFPLMSGIVISIVISAIFWLYRYFLKQ